MRRMSAAMLLLLAGVSSAGAQAPVQQASGTGAARDYTTAFNSLWMAGPDGTRGATTTGFTLEREKASFLFESGQLSLLKPVQGRVIGAVWAGTGRFRFTSPDSMEARRLARYFGGKLSLDVPIKKVVLLFTDSTEAELQGRLQLKGSPVPDVNIENAFEYMGDRNAQHFDPDFMRQVLNGTSEGSFIAYIERDGGSPLTFEVTRAEREGVRLSVKGRGDGKYMENAVQVSSAGESEGKWLRTRRGDVHVSHSRLDVTLSHSSTGDVSYRATSRSTLWAPEPVGPWVPLQLFYKLKVESATWADGSSATFARGKDAGILWVLLPRVLSPGDSLALDLAYAGDMTDRYGDFFYIKAASAWYPRSLDYRSRGTFDLTFHNPKSFALASIGERQESTVSGNTLTTRWVMDRPTRNASFNFGLLKPYRVEQATVPVTVLWSQTGHAEIVRAMVAYNTPVVQEKSVEKAVGTDVASSMQFYQSVFGPPPVKSFYATETPTLHGEAFPGLVHLSYITFINNDKQGEQEIFRAHEAAHQWWGIGVDFAGYRDQWLSEGFSTFSALWYLQASRKETKPYFEALKRWRTEILDRAAEAGPIDQGYRVVTDVEHGRDYDIIVYKKGAWVLHMLRALLIDTRTMNEDRFTAIMKDFYQTYNGQYATTADFQRTVEKHVGQPMGWFFDQWVRGTAIPTYRPTWRFEPTGDGKYRVKLTVVQEGVPDSFMMYVPVTVEFSNGTRARMRVLVKGPKSEPELPLLPAEPKHLVFNDMEGVLARVQ